MKSNQYKYDKKQHDSRKIKVIRENIMPSLNAKFPLKR